MNLGHIILIEQRHQLNLALKSLVDTSNMFPAIPSNDSFHAELERSMNYLRAAIQRLNTKIQAL